VTWLRASRYLRPRRDGITIARLVAGRNFTRHHTARHPHGAGAGELPRRIAAAVAGAAALVAAEGFRRIQKQRGYKLIRLLKKEDRAKARSMFALGNSAPLLPQPEILLAAANGGSNRPRDGTRGEIGVGSGDGWSALGREAAEPAQDNPGGVLAGDVDGVRRGGRRAGLHSDGAIRRSPCSTPVEAQLGKHIEKAADAVAARVGPDGVLAGRVQGRAFAQHETSKLRTGS
jgi:hypothetical protein